MILFFGPVFIVEDTSGQAGAGMAEWLVYCFAVWVVLIAVTALVNRALADGDTQAAAGPFGTGRRPAGLRC